MCSDEFFRMETVSPGQLGVIHVPFFAGGGLDLLRRNGDDGGSPGDPMLGIGLDLGRHPARPTTGHTADACWLLVVPGLSRHGAGLSGRMIIPGAFRPADG